MRNRILYVFLFLFVCCGQKNNNVEDKEEINRYNDFTEKSNYIKLDGTKGLAQSNSLIIMEEFDKPNLFSKYFNNGAFDSLETRWREASCMVEILEAEVA
jgi:hypothetical protein